MPAFQKGSIQLSDELVAHLRSLQTEPNTIFPGFASTCRFSPEDRVEYVHKMRDGNPGRPISVLETGSLNPDEILVCEPDSDNDDDRLLYYRVPQTKEA